MLCCSIASKFWPPIQPAAQGQHALLGARSSACATAGLSALSLFTPDAILQARRGFQSQLSTTLLAAANFNATSAAVVSTAALFEELLPNLAAGSGPVGQAVGQGSGIAAAIALYQHAIDTVPVEVSCCLTIAGCQ